MYPYPNDLEPGGEYQGPKVMKPAQVGKVALNERPYGCKRRIASGVCPQKPLVGGLAAVAFAHEEP